MPSVNVYDGWYKSRFCPGDGAPRIKLPCGQQQSASRPANARPRGYSQCDPHRCDPPDMTVIHLASIKSKPDPPPPALKQVVRQRMRQAHRANLGHTMHRHLAQPPVLHLRMRMFGRLWSLVDRLAGVAVHPVAPLFMASGSCRRFHLRLRCVSGLTTGRLRGGGV